MLNEHPRQQLKTLITQFGRAVCDDPNRCEAILRDLCPEHKRDNLLIATLKERVVTDLLHNSSVQPISLQINQLAQRLHDNLGIAHHFAVWAVQSWALALFISRSHCNYRLARICLFRIFRKSDANDRADFIGFRLVRDV